MNKLKSFLIPSILIILGILTFVIHYLTPFQSDDFNYSLMKYSSLDDRYLYWSGRVPGFVISVFLTSIKSKFIIAIIQTIGVLGIIYFISQLPIKTSKLKFNIWLYLFVFCVYFLFHPDLGESTFWIVGSANYMWTNLIICVYLYFLFNNYFNAKEIIIIKDKPLLSQKITDVLFFLLAFFSGWTNENTAPFVILITIILFISVLIFEKRLDFKLIYYSLFSSLGFLFLILSPGNKIRLDQWQKSTGINWSELSLSSKLEHFNFNLLFDFNFSLIILFIVYISLWLFRKNKILNENRKLSYLSISILFTVISFTSVAILFLSPETPRRALSGSFIFLMIAIVFGYHDLSETFRKTKFQKAIPYVLPTILTSLFIVFYFGKLLPMYISYNNQYKLQVNFIEHSKEKNIKELKIPRMFISQSLMSKRIDIDPFEDSKAFADYFGLEKVEFYSLNKDLTEVGKLEDLYENSLKVILEVQTNDKIVFIFAYKDGTNDIYDNDHKIWKSAKSGQESSQTIDYQAPPGKIEDMQIDFEVSDGQRCEIEKITLSSGKRKIEIPKEDLQNYFTPNKYIEINAKSNELMFNKDEKGNVYPSLKATEYLKSELSKFIVE